jgi:hypothetical protein
MGKGDSSLSLTLIITKLDNHSGYGAYVMGRYWHFVILHEQTYAVHTGLNVADKELCHIFGVLKNTKQIIGEWGRIGMMDETQQDAGQPISQIA